MYMTKKSIVVKIITGLHARPAANLVKLANTFKCTINLTFDDKKINAKDIWDVLNSGIESGEKLVIECDGVDETLAIDKISAFINDEEES